MGQTEKIIAGLEPPALEGLTRAPFPYATYFPKVIKNDGLLKWW